MGYQIHFNMILGHHINVHSNCARRILSLFSCLSWGQMWRGEWKEGIQWYQKMPEGEKWTYKKFGENLISIFVRKCLFVATVATDSAVFVATVATDSAVFVATLPVSERFLVVFAFLFWNWNWLTRDTSSLR